MPKATFQTHEQIKNGNEYNQKLKIKLPSLMKQSHSMKGERQIKDKQWLCCGSNRTKFTKQIMIKELYF